MTSVTNFFAPPTVHPQRDSNPAATLKGWRHFELEKAKVLIKWYFRRSLFCILLSQALHGH